MMFVYLICFLIMFSYNSERHDTVLQDQDQDLIELTSPLHAARLLRELELAPGCTWSSGSTGLGPICPILFLLYTADLLQLVEIHILCPHLYADILLAWRHGWRHGSATWPYDSVRRRRCSVDEDWSAMVFVGSPVGSIRFRRFRSQLNRLTSYS